MQPLPGDPVDRTKWQRVSRAHFQRVSQQYNTGREFEQGTFWAQEIASQVTLSENDWLLDIGCGTGLFTIPFARVLPCRVVGLDLSAAMLAEAKSNAAHGNHWLQGGAERLSFGANVFRAVFLSQVWHHLENSGQAACEFYRVLKPGGKLFIKTFSHAQLCARWDLTTVFPELLPFMLGIYPDTLELAALLHAAGFGRVSHQCYHKDEDLKPSELLYIAQAKLWSMFAYLEEAGRARGMAYLRRLIDETNDAPVPSAELHLLVCAEK